MRNVISENYPNGLNNEELLEAIKDYSKEATIAGRPNSQYVVGPSYWKEMVEIGQSEIANRIQINLFEEIKKLTIEIKYLKDDNRKSSKINLILSTLTIFLAILTVILSYITWEYSKTSVKSDSTWQKELIQVLNQNNVELKEIKSEIMHSNNLHKNLNENSYDIKNKEDIKLENNKKWD